MYTFNRLTSQVRDRRASYGDAPAGPLPDPAAPALRDLTTAPDDAIPLILARFAALRAWRLASAGAHPDLIAHARDAARLYLDATPGGWAEREPLAGLLSEPLAPGRAAELLHAVADRAGAAGHRHGAAEASRAAALAMELDPG